jgi:hypothetical protein
MISLDKFCFLHFYTLGFIFGYFRMKIKKIVYTLNTGYTSVKLRLSIWCKRYYKLKYQNIL